MKKIVMLVFIVMMMAFVTAVQAEVRAGGLPALIVDDSIKDCAGPCPPPCGRTKGGSSASTSSCSGCGSSS